MNKFEMAKLEIKASIEKANIELENATATLKDYMFLGLEVPKTLTNNIKELIEYYKKNTLKGEIVAMLHKFEEKEEIDFDEKIKKLKKLNYKDKEIASILSELYETNKNSVYKRSVS